jgi:hypothetical protein
VTQILRRKFSKKGALFRVANEGRSFVAEKFRGELEFIILETHLADAADAE